MDLLNVGFVGLMTLGFVNVLTFWKPNLDSKIKFGLSLVFAFALLWVPTDLGNMLADKIKTALEIALAASGGYKIAQKIGGQ